MKALLFAALLCLCTPAFAVSEPVVDESRFVSLSESLRCLVCQNQSIAESNADLANDLKRQVREMLAAGRSDEEIRSFMVERYGDFVLYDPPLRGRTVLLWGGPAALLLLSVAGFAWSLRLRRRAAAASSISDAERERARALLRDPE